MGVVLYIIYFVHTLIVKMSKIYLMTFWNEDILGGTIMISHGVDEDTLQNIPLTQEPLSYYIKEIKAIFDEDVGEYYIE